LNGVRNRWPRIFLAAFWFLWTSIIIPAHQRGAIAIAGSACCRCNDNQQNSKSPANRSTTNCAVCQLAAHLMPATVVPVDLQPGELIELITLSPTQRPMVVEHPLCILARGPPFLA
jgi:hypothetical protein